MFRIFGRRAKTIPAHMQAFTDRFLGAAATAIALAESVAEHAEQIRLGRAPFPILETRDTPIIRVWHHLRLEACLGAVRYGDGSLYELADVGNQPKALAEFLDEKAYLAFPQPSGSALAQSVQGMWQAYQHLAEAGTSLADPETDRFILSAGGKTILSDLERGARISQAWWGGQDATDLPPTLFGLFFDDLNQKTKSIALSKLFGPRQLQEAPAVIAEVLKARGDKMAEEMRQLIDVLKDANNPDQAVTMTKSLSIAEYI